MMTMLRLPLRRALGLCALGAAIAGCSNAGEDLGFGPRGTGTVQVLVFLDRDGSGASSTLDTVVSGVRVGLLVSGTSDTVATGTSDSQGIIQLSGVPAGDYRLVVDSATVADSIRVQDTGPVLQLRAGGPAQLGLVRLGYPTATVAEARQLQAGTLVQVSGIILAGPTTFSDTTAYLGSDSAGLRLTGAVSVNFPVMPGDSVHVVGTTAVRDGQPVLDQARIYAYSIQGGAPAPRLVTTLEASSAAGGSLDAQLVTVSAAVISDTATITPDFRITADDGTGSLDVILDPRVTTATSSYIPGKVLTATGILVPRGNGTWVLKPRSTQDLSVQ